MALKNIFKKTYSHRRFNRTEREEIAPDIILSTNKAIEILSLQKQKINSEQVELGADKKRLNKKLDRQILNLHKTKEQLDKKIDFVRNGGARVAIPFLKNSDLFLRRRLLWYRNWHNNSISPKLHLTAFGSYLIISVFLALFFMQGVPNNTSALKEHRKTSLVSAIYTPDNLSLKNSKVQLPQDERPVSTIYEDNLAVDFSDKSSKLASAKIRTMDKNNNEQWVEFVLLQPKHLEQPTPESVSSNSLIDSSAHAEAENTLIEADIIDIAKDANDSKVTLNVNDSLAAQYEVSSNDSQAVVKETLIIEDARVFSNNPDYTISFKLKTNGLKIIQRENGNYALSDEIGLSVMNIEPPIIEDSNKAKGNITLTIVDDIATYTIDKDYIDNAEYPIYLDPTVTVSTSTITNPNSYAKDRTLLETSDGTLVNIYSDGSAINYRTSSDKGANWSAATKITDTTIADDNGFSAWIDVENNIHLAYSDNNTNSYIYYRNLSYSFATTNITIGAEKTVESAGTSRMYPSIVATESSSTVYVAYRYYDGSDYTIRLKSSSDFGDNWSAAATISATTNASAATYPCAILWNDKPAVIYNYQNSSLRWNYYDGSSWQSAGWVNEIITSELDADTGLEFTSIESPANNYLHLAWRGSGVNGIRYLKNNNSASGWDGASTAITADHNDRFPSVGAGTNDYINLYYSDYVGANSYNIKYLSKSSAGSFGAVNSVTTDDANNLVSHAAQKANYYRNNSLLFDGTDDHADLPDGFSDFTGGLTLELWAYPTAAQNYARFINLSNGAPNNNIVFGRTGTTTNLAFVVCNGTASCPTAVTATGVLELNKWQHFVVTQSAAGAVTIYKNGVSVATGTQNVPTNISRTINYIGRGAWVTDSYYKGNMDGVRIYNRLISSDEVTAHYRSGIGPKKIPTDTNQLAAYNFDESSGSTSTDASGNSMTATLVSSPSFQINNVPYKNSNNYAIYSPNSNGYITVPAAASTNTNTTNFTMEAWVKARSTGAWRWIMGKNNSGNWLGINSSGYLNFSTSRGVNNTSSTAYVTDEKWHHVAVTFDTGTLKLYMDGKNTDTWTGKTVSAQTGATYIGYNGYEYYYGWINEARLWTKTLSAGDVLNRFSAGMFASGAPEADLGAGWSMNEASGTTVADFSGNGNTGTFVNTLYLDNVLKTTLSTPSVSFVEGTGSPYNIKWGPKAKTWTGMGANTNWTTVENWSDGVAPAAGDYLLFDGPVGGISVADSVPDNLGTIEIVRESSITLLFSKHPSTNANTFKINLTGDCIINGGIVQSEGDTTVIHGGVTDGQGNELAASNIFIGASGTFNLDGMGFPLRQGPGRIYLTNDERGSGHGGQGGGSPYGGSAYGDYSDPVSLGSGNYRVAGGGAIKLNASQSLIVDGSLTANGLSNYGGSAGGSLNLNATDISGTGTIKANGGTGDYGTGGGGRIKMSSTTNSFIGTLQAKAGNESSNINGGAGTIYKKLSSQTYGDLIIDNVDASQNNRNQTAAFLKTMSGDTGNYQFDSLTFANYGKLEVTSGQSLALDSGTITGSKTAGVINAGTVSVPDNWSLAYYYSHKNGALSGWTQTGLTVTSAGKLTHYINDSADTYGLNLSLDSLTVDSGGEIDVSDMGYASQQGPGKGKIISYGDAGGYGGEGGRNDGDMTRSNPYGDYSNPTDLGSGGGGSGGGGKALLTITGTATINGSLIANGQSAYAGGSGGSINLSANTITGNGTIMANGGNGGAAYSGGGGGGRVRLASTANSFSGNLTARGGSGYSSYYSGGPGTIFKKLASQSHGDLIIDDNGNTHHARYFMGAYLKDKADNGTYQFDSIQFSNYGKLEVVANQTINATGINITGDKNSGFSNAGTISLPSTWNLSYLYMHRGGTISDLVNKSIIVTSTGFLTHYFNSSEETYTINWTLSSIEVQTGGEINATNNGYAANNGPGVGATAGLASGSGGGAYGGNGAAGTVGAGGTAYGSVTNPTNIGSGGGGGLNAGGGAIILNVNTLNLSGTIAANGADSTAGEYAGGGGGGTVNITANTISGSSATISANGGYSKWQGGGGGGGRIAINYANDSYTGGITSLNISAKGGMNGISRGEDATRKGAAGTIYIKRSSDTYGSLKIDNAVATTTAARTPLSLPLAYSDVTITNYGKATISTNADTAQNTFAVNGNLTVGANSELILNSDNDGTPSAGAWPIITVTGDANVSGSITSNATGYIHDLGSGKGNISGSYGSGAGYGGSGGNSANGAVGGSTYGTDRDNNYIGSGGGATNGGAGGGMIKMSVSGTLDLSNTGTIASNGGAGGTDGGGGSGGSIQIVCTTLSGSAGSTISSNGGAGGANGGGGGGGRITIYPSIDSYLGSLTATGGTAGSGGATAGQNGTAIIQHTPSSLTMNSPNDAATNQIQKTVLRFNSTDLDDDWIQYKLQIATDVNFTIGVSTFDQTLSQNPSDGGRSAIFSNQDRTTGNVAGSDGYSSGREAILTLQTNLTQARTYYWRFYAYDPEGVDSFDGNKHWSPASSTRSFTVASIDHISFSTPQQQSVVTFCSAIMTVNLRDSSNNNIYLTDDDGAKTLQLSSTSVSGSFFSDSDCQTAIPSEEVSIAVSGNSASFFYMDTTPSPVNDFFTITVAESPSEGLTDATQQIRVNPGDLGSFEISGTPVSVTAGQPFSSPANDITVTVKDIFGNVKNDWTGQIWFYSSDSQADLDHDDTNKYTYTSGDGLDNGTHTFDGSEFVLKTKGNQSLVVHNSTGGEYDEVVAVTVNPAAIDHFTLSDYPRTASGRFAMSSFSWDTPGYSSAPYSPVVTAYDAYGNIKDDYAGETWFELYKSSDTPGNPLDSSANYVFDYDYTNHYTFTSGDGDDNGTHTFDGSGFTVVTAANDLRLRVKTSSNGGIYTDFTITVKPQSIDHFLVSSNPALSRDGVNGDKEVDEEFSEDITVTAYDTFGNVKTDYFYNDTTKAGMIYFYSSDPQAILPHTKTLSTDSSACFNFPEAANGSYIFSTTNTPTNYFKFSTGGPQTISVSECIDPTSEYATGTDNKYDPRLEGTNPTKVVAAIGQMPEGSGDPNKIFVANHVPGSTHTALDHSNNSNNLIEAGPGHEQATLSWTNSFDLPSDPLLDTQVYIYRCTTDCGDVANFSRIVTDPVAINVTAGSISEYTDTGLTNGTEYFYKLSYAYKRQDESYIESDKSITVSTTPADIAPRNISATQLDITDITDPGKVRIDYQLRWDSTVSLAYYNPATNSWHNASPSAMSGDVGVGITGDENLISHTAYLDPNIDFDGQYLTDTFKVRVRVTVGSANTYADSTTFGLDTKNPAGVSLIVDATDGASADLYLSASDDNELSMKVSGNSNFNGAEWQSFTESIEEFDISGLDSVFVIYRDAFNNTTTVEQEIFSAPENVSIKDGSSAASQTYRLLITWDDLIPMPEHYNVFRSVDGENYSHYDTTIKDAAIDINLDPDTLYSYKIQAEDEAGNKSALSNAVSSRPGTAPDVTADPAVELFGWKQDVGVRAKITWDTDQNSDSFVAFAKEPIKSGSDLDTESGNEDAVFVVGSPDMVTSHEINLSNLEPSTKYYFKVLSKNEIQITGYSDVFEFTTPERVLLLISGMKITDITNNSAFISWTTSKISTTLVEYGSTSQYGSTIEDLSQNTEHKFKLEDLTSGDYHLRVSARDVDGNLTISDEYIFNIPPTPLITNISITDVSDNTAKVAWTTNVACNSNVDIEGESGNGSQGNASYTTNHSVNLVGLSAKTNYSLRIRSVDTYGNTAISESKQITTTADLFAPKILNPKSEITSTGSGENIKYQLIVSWETDEPSTSKVEFGQGVGNAYESSSKEDLSLNMTHTIIVTDLKPNSVYHFRIKSGDKANNIAYSDDYTITTPPKEKDIISIIINAIIGPMNDIYQGVINKLFKR